MKLSTKTRYGARILIDLAQKKNQEPIQVSKIASSQNIPVKYLEQILRKLKMAGFVQSIRGSRGGYFLAEPANTITLGKIVRLFEGQTDLVECVSFPEKCDKASECLVRQAWYTATDALYKELDNITIAGLIEKGAGLNPSICRDMESCL